MFAWNGVVVVILSCINLGTYSSNNCNYYNYDIDCKDNLDYIPYTLSETLTDYISVSIHFGN